MATRRSVSHRGLTVRRALVFASITVLVASCGNPEVPSEQVTQREPNPGVSPENVIGTDCTPHGAAVALIGVQHTLYDSTAFLAPFGDRTIEPNTNDCQRLSRPGGPNGQYGPLAYLLPYSAVLDTLTKARLNEADVLVAAILVDTAENVTAYPELHLRGGLNCAYLRGSGNSMRVRILRLGATPECDPDATTNGAPQLNVYVHAVALSDVPSVGRWEEGMVGATTQPYFGIRCPAGWCEVGPASLVREPPLASSGAKQVRIKGWYDRQILAHIDNNGQLARSGVVGTIIPDEDLGTYEVSDFKAGWLPVAIVEMGATVQKYEKAFGLKQGRNRLELTIDVNGGWKGRITAADGKEFAVKIVPAHLHHDPAAVARWGWWENDETMWVRCAYGCCQVSGPE
jgi:hypothetical protein